MSQDGKGKRRQNSNPFVTSWKNETIKHLILPRALYRDICFLNYWPKFNIKAKRLLLRWLDQIAIQLLMVNSNYNQITRSSFLGYAAGTCYSTQLNNFLDHSFSNILLGSQ